MGAALERVSSETIARFEEAFSTEMVGRNCRLEEYRKISVPTFSIGGEMIAYCSPDSTFAATKRLLDRRPAVDLDRHLRLHGEVHEGAAFQGDAAWRAVSLMLDLDDRTGETALFNELGRHGAEVVPAPSCASKHAKYFSSSHEKVIVIDDNWTLVQSGNWSDASIPLNEVDGGNRDDFEHGNRDMGLAIKSKPLAKFFTKILRSDMQAGAGCHAGGASSAWQRHSGWKRSALGRRSLRRTCFPASDSTRRARSA